MERAWFIAPAGACIRTTAGVCGGHIAKSLTRTAIALGLRCLEFVFVVGRWCGVVGRVIATDIRTAAARGVRVAIPAYRAWWVFHRTFARSRAQVLARVLTALTHRAIAYVAFALAILFVASQSLHAREYGGFIGDRPLLTAFVASSDEAEEVEEFVEGPAVPTATATFRAASVRAFTPTVLGAEVVRAASVPTTAGFALVQPVLTDDAVTASNRAGITTYTVETGDTPSTIAERYGLKLTTLLWENKLQAWSVIQPGQTLRILPTDGVTHTVKRGETLEQIAKKYHADAEETLEFNRLVDADDLEVGDVLILPDGRPPQVVVPQPVRRVIVQPGVPLPAIAGKLFWPSVSDYRISQYFTWRHHGLDIAAQHGTSVFASDAGTIESSGWMRGYGYQVTIDHGNGVRTRYAHNSKLLVTKGQHVDRGQEIALVGSTGRSTGPHIHFEVFVNGRRVNPVPYLR